MSAHNSVSHAHTSDHPDAFDHWLNRGLKKLYGAPEPLPPSWLQWLAPAADERAIQPAGVAVPA